MTARIEGVGVHIVPDTIAITVLPLMAVVWEDVLVVRDAVPIAVMVRVVTDAVCVTVEPLVRVVREDIMLVFDTILIIICLGVKGLRCGCRGGCRTGWLRRR